MLTKTKIQRREEFLYLQHSEVKTHMYSNPAAVTGIRDLLERFCIKNCIIKLWFWVMRLFLTVENGRCETQRRRSAISCQRNALWFDLPRLSYHWLKFSLSSGNMNHINQFKKIVWKNCIHQTNGARRLGPHLRNWWCAIYRIKIKSL